jgi:MFS transporter, PAT family, beta-lactamase induction signal transducer AmpG
VTSGHDSRSTSPATFFVLVLPHGISAGFVNVTLPFVLTRAGFPVALTASVVAIGISSNLWRFLWGPVADLTLTLRRWYVVGLLAAAASLLLLGVVPFRQSAFGVLMTLVFVSQVAATFVVLPVGGLMAHTVETGEKGRAAGWYQAGNLGGIGLGGGAGVWLASHFSVAIAAAALTVAMVACAAALAFVPDVRPLVDTPIGRRMIEIGRDFRELLRSPIALLVTILVMSPIGAGAATNLWSAVAPDWRATPDTVALVTGALSGIVSALGCVMGGWTCDRIGRWWAFFGSGAVMAGIAIVMAAAPHTPVAYNIGVLFYAASTGLSYAAFSALLLYAIGRGAASTKYATLSSLGNLPTTYMTAFDGWVHDRSGAAGMLNAEALLGAGSIVLGLIALKWIVGVRGRASPHPARTA